MPVEPVLLGSEARRLLNEPGFFASFDFFAAFALPNGLRRRRNPYPAFWRKNPFLLPVIFAGAAALQSPLDCLSSSLPTP